MISLSTFKPEYFNNNGDQGNIEVLQKQLAWRGVDSITTTSDFEGSDFLLIGDAARASMRQFEPDLVGLIPLLEGRLRTGSATLLVGSAFEFYSGKVSGLPAVSRSTRSSEFRVVKQASFEAFGYRNSEAVDDLFVKGAFIGTTLFGPVLAKSPALLGLMLKSLNVDSPLPGDISAELNHLLGEARKANAG